MRRCAARSAPRSNACSGNTRPADARDANAGAKAAFEAFAPSHRREYLEWILEAKRAETRARRIAQAIGQLAEGKSRHWKYERR
ncbi:MAG: YdeI/OmpD-associated family protein [Pseudomonadota bacterium]